MTPVALSVLVALTLDILLGVGIYLTNPHRPVNQAFALLALLIGGWLSGNLFVLHAETEAAARAGIAWSSFFAVVIPFGCHLLRVSIARAEEGLAGAFRRLWILLLVAGGVGALCFLHPWFLIAVRVPGAGEVNEVAEPTYGPGIFVFLIYLAGSLGSLLILTQRNLEDVPPGRRAELQFIMLATSVALLQAIFFSLVFTLTMNTAHFVPMANALTIGIMISILSYGIATRRIMGVAELLRRLAAVSLLVLYLGLLYTLADLGARRVAAALNWPTTHGPHVLATFVVCLAILPIRGGLAAFTNRLFPSSSRGDAANLLHRAAQEMQTVTTLDELLRRFSARVADLFHTDPPRVFLRQERTFVQAYPAEKGTPTRIPAASPLVEWLRQNREPVTAVDLVRRRPTPLVTAVLRQLTELDMELAAGLFAQTGLEGLLLLGPRRSGLLYEAQDQVRLDALADPLAAALANSRLYTQVQDARRYNETLLDSLTSGVLASDPGGRITVFNREAQRITHRDPAEVLGQPIADLPLPLKDMMEQALGGRTVRERTVDLPAGGETIPLRVGAVPVRSHDGRPLGALLVFYDLTEVRRLEERLHRQDRLAAVGTLAAGMAHEIKNPLVTLKTFAQLLPGRFDDPEVRETFCPLIVSEVDRIDRIVSQVLGFSRPAAPHMSVVHLHEILEKTLRLVAPQVEHRQLRVVTEWTAPDDRILGDASQLEQVFVNFYFNAMDAMKPGGVLTVSSARLAIAPLEPRLRISVRDTGVGIPPEQRTRVFDPFYTTKDGGTGLGLSVAHGIITQHKGSVDVESAPGSGTVFLVWFPALSEERA